MFQVKIAGIVFQVDNKYKYVYDICKDYLVENEKTQLVISISNDEIEKQKGKLDKGLSSAYAESLCVYRKISYIMSDFDAFLMHASCVEMDGEAYCFLAPSGTGKTTHSLNWIKAFGERASIINGDKPIIRFIDDMPFVFGTPYCGKERFNQNKNSKIKAICFIERAEKNEILKIDEQSAIVRLFKQVLVPNDKEKALKVLGFIDKLVDKVPLYLLKCNMNVDSAVVAYNGMKGL